VPRDDNIVIFRVIARSIATKQSQTGIAGIRKRSPRHFVPRDDIARVWYKEAITRVIARSIATKQSQTGIAGI